jgi:hypothetical protein
MTIIRRHHNCNFTIVPNAIFEDDRLSIEAKGVLGYLLSRPHNWVVRLVHIGATLKIGRDKTERIFQERQAVGYVIRGPDQKRTKGKWSAAEYVVLDDPASASVPEVGGWEDQPDTAAAPCPEKPLTAKTHAAFQGTYKGLKDDKTDSNNDADDAGARDASKSLIAPKAFALCNDLLRLLHLEQDDPRGIGMAYTIQGWLTKGWNADVIRQAVEVVMSRRTDAPKGLRYFEPAIAEAHAERNRPLPVVPHNVKISALHNRGPSKYANHQNGGGFALNEFARRAARQPDSPDQS